MTQTVIINLVVCVCALAGYIMGARTYFKPDAPLYSQMVAIALGCAALGRLYNVVIIVCDGSIPYTFNTGVLATVGCFMFFFSANYGQMDSLCEMEDKRNRKYRWLALAAPLVPAVCMVLIFLFCSGGWVLRLTYAVELAAIMLAAYFNCKHLLVHDVEGGIIGSIRGYNLDAMLLGLLYTTEIFFDAMQWVTPKSIVYVLMSICLLVMIPVLKRGGKQWKI